MLKKLFGGQTDQPKPCAGFTENFERCRNMAHPDAKYCSTHLADPPSEQARRKRIYQANHFLSIIKSPAIITSIITSILAIIALSANIAGGLDFLAKLGLVPRDPIYTLNIEGDNQNVIVARTADGTTLWLKELDTTLQKVWKDDLDNNGSIEVIASTQSPGEHPGLILIYDEGGELLAEFNT